MGAGLAKEEQLAEKEEQLEEQLGEKTRMLRRMAREVQRSREEQWKWRRVLRGVLATAALEPAARGLLAALAVDGGGEEVSPPSRGSSTSELAAAEVGPPSSRLRPPLAGRGLRAPQGCVP